MHEITMNGPGKNSLGTEMMTFLLEQLDAARGDPVLLRGAGDAFSAGLDLREVASLDAEEMTRFLMLLERCMATLYLYPGPTVAFVNGHAIAGGCVLALACDHRVAVNRAGVKIGLNEVALGLRFPPRVLAIVRGRLPPVSLPEVVLGAGLFEPPRARALGLVDEVADEAEGRARAHLETLAKHPADAYAWAKRDLRGATPADLATDDELRRWCEESIGAWTSPALKQKISSLFRKG
jgi:enoyl-CoA hydratase/carnithine racemase